MTSGVVGVVDRGQADSPPATRRTSHCQVKVDKKLNGKLTAVTAMSSFDLFITCETSQTTTEPTTAPLLPLHYIKS